MSPYTATPEAIEQLKGRTTGWSRDEETGQYTYIVREPTGLPQRGEMRKAIGVFAETPPEIVPMEERGQYGLPTTVEQPEQKVWTPYQMFDDRRETQEKWVQQKWDNEYDLALKVETLDPNRAAMIRENANQVRQIELQELNGWSNEIRIGFKQNRENRQLSERETYLANEGMVRDAEMPIKQPRIEIPEPPSPGAPYTAQQMAGDMPEDIQGLMEDFIDKAVKPRLGGWYWNRNVNQDELIKAFEDYKEYIGYNTLSPTKQGQQDLIWEGLMRVDGYDKWKTIPERKVEVDKITGREILPSPEMQLLSAPAMELEVVWPSLNDEQKRKVWTAFNNGYSPQEILTSLGGE